MPWVLHRERPDVFHAPHYVLPPATRCRSVVTIHDCIHLMFPQYLPNRAAYAYAAASMWRAARRSHRILTVSEASKRDIIHFFNVPPEKIVVVYNAIDERFRRAPSEEDVARVRERYQLNHGFVLYVGNIKPHKNLVRLIEAFDELRQRGFDELKLLIIGDEISKLPALRRAVHSHKLHKHVRFLGYLPDETLAVLYRLAAVFVFPSLYEGFGLPPLEAMASGTPVVTSNVSSMPEVTGDAAVLVDPTTSNRSSRGCARADRSRAERGAAREGHRARARVLLGALGGPHAGALSGGRRAAHENGADPRLADRHARRRTRARGAVRAVSGRRHLHAVPRPRLGVAGDRATSHRDVVRAAPAAGGDATTGSTCRSSRWPSSSSTSIRTTW